MTGSARLSVTLNEDIATVLVGDGLRANVLGTRDWKALADLFQQLASDAALRAVVLSGRGTTSFSAGSDMREWLHAEPSQVDASFAAMESAFTAIERMPIPVIAAVRGAATGAGCQLACACDLRIVADTARIGMPIARWGILVPPAFASRLASVISISATRDLLLTGRLVDGEEATRLGLATAHVPEPDLDAKSAAVAEAITQMPADAVRSIKRSIDFLLSPQRQRLGGTSTGPSADYASLQEGVAGFLSAAAEDKEV